MEESLMSTWKACERKKVRNDKWSRKMQGRMEEEQQVWCDSEKHSSRIGEEDTGK